MLLSSISPSVILQSYVNTILFMLSLLEGFLFFCFSPSVDRLVCGETLHEQDESSDGSSDLRG